MYNNGPKSYYAQVGYLVSILAVLSSLALLFCCIFIVPLRQADDWWKSESASIERLRGEIGRYGGHLKLPPGAVDISERRVALDIDLSYSNVGDKEFAQLVAMDAFKHLHTLDLAATRITDDSLDLLGKRRTPILLDVSKTDITDRGLELIAKYSNLVTLRLAGTRVTDRGMEALMNASPPLDLRGLDLRGTLVSEKCINQLLNKFAFLSVDRQAVRERSR